MLARDGITWDRSEAIRGVACAIPGALVAALWDVGLGCALALGTISVGLLGVPPARSARARLFVGALLFAAGYGAGTIVVAWPALAVLATAVAAYASIAYAGHGALARLLPALVVPAFVLGMNHPALAGLIVAASFVVGGLWATVVTVLWPSSMRIAPRASAAPAPGDAPPAERPATPDPRVYAVLFALAGAVGLVIGFVAGFVHVAWTAGAALLIMRPVPDLTARRSIERVIATFLGITAAAVLIRFDPSSVGIALVTVGALGVIFATRSSTWYLTSGATGLVVLLMAGVAGTTGFTETYLERLLETAVGAALALLLGVLVPRLLASRASLSRRPN